jgi:hypothetical protein
MSTIPACRPRQLSDRNSTIDSGPLTNAERCLLSQNEHMNQFTVPAWNCAEYDTLRFV